MAREERTPENSKAQITSGEENSTASNSPDVAPAGTGNVSASAPLSKGNYVASLGVLSDVSMEITAVLGRTNRKLSEILSLGPGSMLELDRLAGENVDLLINGKLVAKGEVVVIGEHFGVRITEIIKRSQ